MVAVLEKAAYEIREEGRARSVNLFPDVIEYGVWTGGGGARGLDEHAGNLILTEGKVVCKAREVDVSLGRGGRGWKEVV